MRSKVIIQSPLLSRVENLVHAYSSRPHGDMRKEDVRSDFITRLGLDGSAVSKPKQIHGTTVACVDTRNFYPIVEDVDGLVSNGRSLSLISADCAPLLAVDPYTNILGVAHAGWKGTIGGIARNLIGMMVKQGANVPNICVSIGPCIGFSCYTVSSDRAEQFQKKYGVGDIVKKIDSAWHIDIAEANVRELCNAGVRKTNIDVINRCTSCNNNTLFSYRKDTDESYGEMVGVIGWKN